MNNNPFELTLGDIMSRDVVTVAESDNVDIAVKKMQEKSIGAVVVLDISNNIAGIFSERDVLFRVAGRELDPVSTLISAVMTKNPRTLNSNTSVFDAFELTQEGRFRHIPIVDKGSLVGIVSVRDINKAFYAEKDALNEMKMKFAMITSHELKTPCAVIKSCIYLLKDDSENLSEESRDLIRKIDKNINRLGGIMKDLERLYSSKRPAADKGYKLSSIEEVIRDAVDDITPVIIERNMDLSADIDEEIPEILMSPEAIKEVIMNLLLNAIRFTRDNGKITVRARNEVNSIRVEVEDNGIGIPANKLSRIFESFYEAGDVMKHSSGKSAFRSGGLGIGLSIAKNTLEAHKGNIRAESEEGKFSRFIFTLPKG